MVSALGSPWILTTIIFLILSAITFVYYLAKRAKDKPRTLEGHGGPKVRRGFAPTIGLYHLGLKTTDAFDLVELTQTEKEAFNLVFEFRNERLFKTPPAVFAGAEWEMVLAAVDDFIYKVSALLALTSRGQRDKLWQELNGLFRTSLGAPHTESPSIIVWYTEDGNVLVNRVDSGGEYFVVLTLTSKAVATFERVK